MESPILCIRKMKRAQSFWNQLSSWGYSFVFCKSASPHSKNYVKGKDGSGKSEIKSSKDSITCQKFVLRPSAIVVGIVVIVCAISTLFANEETPIDEIASMLTKAGWSERKLDFSICDSTVKKSSFFEIWNSEHVAQFYISSSGRFLAADSSLPIIEQISINGDSDPIHCSSINNVNLTNKI